MFFMLMISTKLCQNKERCQIHHEGAVGSGCRQQMFGLYNQLRIGILQVYKYISKKSSFAIFKFYEKNLLVRT